VVGGEGIERGPQPVIGSAITTGKTRIVFGMGDVQAGFARQQEFAGDGGHGFIDGHGMAVA